MDFSGKVVLVTGSSRGLGKALAIEFAKAGASVIVAARSETTGKLPGTIGETVAEIEALGGTAAAVRANVAQEEDLVHLAEASLERFGRVDVLVNNAGISMPYNQLAWEIPAKGWDLVTAINIRAPFRLSSLLLPQMIERGGGSIVNISSMAAANNYSGVQDSDGSVNRVSVAYGTSKAALERFTTGLAEHAKEYNIAVNALSPGAPTWSEGFAGNLSKADHSRWRSPYKYFTKAGLFLAGQDATGITGGVFLDHRLCREHGLV